MPNPTTSTPPLGSVPLSPQQLRSFLANKMPVADDFRPRLDLIPKVTNNGAGGGQFALGQQTYRKCRKADKRTPIMVWVDADIYVRNEGVVAPAFQGPDARIAAHADLR